MTHPYFQPQVDTKTLLQPIFNFIDGVNFMLHTMKLLTQHAFQSNKFTLLAFAQKAHTIVTTK